MTTSAGGRERWSGARLRQIRELQDRAARAVPAAEQQHRDGCWLRHTDSPTTWWAGAALVHGSDRVRDLAPVVAAAEDFYAARGAPSRFQVCPACPPGLDDVLSRRRYRRGGAVSLQLAGAEQVGRRLSPAALQVELQESPGQEWLHLLLSAQDLVVDAAAEWRLLQRVDGPSAYATAHVSGRPVSVGRAVVDTGWTGVFAMATLPWARRQGAAAAVLAALAAWGEQRGAEHVYLQVTGDSTAARRLYQRAGFQEACTYHYRVREDLPRAAGDGPAGPGS